MVTAALRRVRGAGELTIVDESDDIPGPQRITVLVGVDREVRQRVAADSVQDPRGIFGDYLDVTVKQDPVAGERLVAVT